MTEEEAKKALFQVHYDYMMHNPKERLQLYNEYQRKRSEIKKELAKAILERKKEEEKNSGKGI